MAYPHVSQLLWEMGGNGSFQLCFDSRLPQHVTQKQMVCRWLFCRQFKWSFPSKAGQIVFSKQSRLLQWQNVPDCLTTERSQVHRTWMVTVLVDYHSSKVTLEQKIRDHVSNIRTQNRGQKAAQSSTKNPNQNTVAHLGLGKLQVQRSNSILQGKETKIDPTPCPNWPTHMMVRQKKLLFCTN